MSTVTAQPESREDALIRLADRARTSGVKLFQDRADGRFYASSRSQPGAFHRLSGFSCSCRGFVSHGRCCHLAALHAALGWLDPEPETPEPTPAASSTGCSSCNGTGTVPATVSTGPGKWAYGNETCSGCHGTGEVAIAA